VDFAEAQHARTILLLTNFEDWQGLYLRNFMFCGICAKTKVHDGLPKSIWHTALL
jgi:hypothetical protein